VYELSLGLEGMGPSLPGCGRIYYIGQGPPAYAAKSGGIGLGGRSSTLIRYALGTPAARCDRTGSSTIAWSGVCAMRGRKHGHGVSRLARAAAPRSASRRAARSHRVRWPARRTSGRAASDRPATAASRWRKPCPLLVVTNGTNGGSSRSVQPFSRSRSRAPARSNHGVPPADSAHSWTTAGTARTATRRPGRCRAAPRTTWTRR
jgi:hypothetical protein